MVFRSWTRIGEHHCLFVLSLTISTIVGLIGVADTVFGADVFCKFKAETDPTEVIILSNGKTSWSGTGSSECSGPSAGRGDGSSRSSSARRW